MKEYLLLHASKKSDTILVVVRKSSMQKDINCITILEEMSKITKLVDGNEVYYFNYKIPVAGKKFKIRAGSDPLEIVVKSIYSYSGFPYFTK